jgi:chromosome segregation ATPase
MWDEFRTLYTRRQELATLLEEMEEREAIACERADRIEKKVFRLTRKYGRLLQDKEETEEWIAEGENLGGGTPEERKRKTNARQALEAIMREIRQLSARACALDEKRWRWRSEELKAEDGQYKLEENIERLRAELEAVLARGCD